MTGQRERERPVPQQGSMALTPWTQQRPLKHPVLMEKLDKEKERIRHLLSLVQIVFGLTNILFGKGIFR